MDTPKTDASVAYDVANRMQLEFTLNGEKGSAACMEMVKQFFRGMVKDEQRHTRG